MMSRNSYTLRLPPDTYRRLRLYAFLAEVSMNDVARQAVRNFLTCPRRGPLAEPEDDPSATRTRVPLRFPDDEHDRIRHAATRHGSSANAVVAAAVEQFLNEPARAGALTRAMRTLDQLGPL